MKAKKAGLVEIRRQTEKDEISDVYDDDFLSDSLESDMISAEEQGFMMGYLGGA